MHKDIIKDKMEGREVTFAIKKKREKLTRTLYLQLFLCWVVHHSMSPQALLINNETSYTISNLIHQVTKHLTSSGV